MDIHEMIGAATTSIRAMQITLETTQKKLANSEEDNNRLREAYAKETAARLNAQADLVHFQTVFEANVCLEAMKICKKMFTLTHDSMLAEASEAVKRMVEEKQEKERDEKPEAASVETTEEEPAKETSLEEGTIVAPPGRLEGIQLKQFYRNSHLHQVPNNWRERPKFVFRDGGWTAFNDLMPEQLTAYLHTPRVDLRSSVARTVLGAFGI